MATKIDWRQPLKGVVLYTFLIVSSGIGIMLFDKGQVGVCADSIITVFFLVFCGFLAAMGASENEAATGALVGIGAIIPQSLLNILAERFSIISLLTSIVLFSFFAALGGVAAQRAKHQY